MSAALAIDFGIQTLVDEAALKAAGAHGVVKLGEIVQVVVGPNADTIAEDIEDLR